MKRIVTLLLALSMLLSLVACGSKGAPSSEGNKPVENTEKTKVENTEKTKKEDLIIVMNEDLVSFDPTSSSTLSNIAILNLIYSRLYANDENLAGIPQLAETVTYASDTELVIKIYENAKFSDGSNVTAEDVRYSLMRAKNSSLAASLMKPILSVDIVDEHTVKITTDGVYPGVTTALSNVACSIIPKAYGEEAEKSNDWSKPVGSGHYVFESRNIGSEIVLKKNDNYFNPQDSAQNNKLTFKVIPEGTNRTIMVEVGEADLNIQFQSSDYERVMADKNLTLHSYPSLTEFFVCMDLNKPEFSDKRVRQAVNMVIDKEAVLLAGYDGLGKTHYSYVAPSCLGFKDMSAVYTIDVEKAKALMAEAGYANGFTTNLVVWNDTLERVATVVQSYLALINITANITRVEAGVRPQLDAAGELPMYVGSWGCYQDPDLFLGRHFSKSGLGGNNWSHFVNDEFESLYALGRSTTDKKIRADAYGKIQDLLVEECPWCPLFVSNIFALANKDLQGVEINGEMPFNFHKLHY